MHMDHAMVDGVHAQTYSTATNLAWCLTKFIKFAGYAGRALVYKFFVRFVHIYDVTLTV